jgi:hypothetical protein
MVNIKRKLSSILVLTGICANVYAAVIPNQVDTTWKDRLFFEGSALYGTLRNTGVSNLEYAQTSSGNNFRSYTPGLEYNWGFSLAAGAYLDEQKKSDLVLSYKYLSLDSTHRVSGSTLYNMLGQVDTDGAVGKNLTNGSAVFKPEQTFQSLELTNHNQISNPFLIANVDYIKFYNIYGLRFVHYKNDFKATYSSATETDTINFSSKSYGVGPRFGLGSEWMVNNMFSIGANTSYSFLVGKHNATWNETNTNPGTFYQKNDDLWTASAVDLNIYAQAKYQVNQNKSLKVKVGLNGERYIGSNADKFNSEDSGNSISIKDTFNLVNVFASLTYYC